MPQVRGGKHGKSSPGERTGTLQKSEADDFLKFLFINVARRPAKLTMRECMRVARYLDWLARDGVPKAAVSKGLNAVKAHRGRLPSVEERDKKWCVSISTIFSGDACERCQGRRGGIQPAGLTFPAVTCADSFREPAHRTSFQLGAGLRCPRLVSCSPARPRPWFLARCRRLGAIRICRVIFPSGCLPLTMCSKEPDCIELTEKSRRW